MKQTENLKLNKIELTDSADITVINPNWDSIDNEITKIKTNKADTSYVNETVATQLGGKVDKETGKGLSTNDFTTAEKTKLNGITANATKTEASSTNGKIKINGIETTVYTHPSGSNPHGTTKADVGLGSVDNTSDLNKPISRATQSALDEKAPLSHVLDVDIHITPEEREAWNKGGTPDLATPTADGIMSKEDKSKLDGVELGANNYTHPSTHPASMITGLVGVIYPDSEFGEVFNDYENNIASGAYSHAEGKSVRSIGESSHAEGERTTASGYYSHAEGFSSILADMNNEALSGDDADKACDYWIEFDEDGDGDGRFSISWGHASHCEGYDTATFGIASHAEGATNVAKGDCSHAEGVGNIASGMCSHVEGIASGAQGDYSHAEGFNSNAKGESSHAEGHGTKANGDYSHAEGVGSEANGIASHAEGGTTTAKGNASHAEGSETTALGENSHVEGYKTKASGESSHAEGERTTSSGRSSHTEGCKTTAKGMYSHAEGFSSQLADITNTNLSGTNVNNAYNYWDGLDNSNKFNISWGIGSHCEGRDTATFGEYAHAEGYKTVAKGNNSHAEGLGSKAIGNNSHAEGCVGIANGTYSHAEGDNTVANGVASHAEGFQTKADGGYSHAEGYKSEAKGNYSHAEGSNTIASSTGSHAEGCFSKALASYSHAEGYYTTTSGSYSHAEGANTIAEGESSHAEGKTTKTSGNCSHAEGYGSKANGHYSHAEGRETTASGESSHAEGDGTVALGRYSHAEGYKTKANSIYSHAEGNQSLVKGDASHAEGQLTIASGDYSHAEGLYATSHGNCSHAEGENTYAQGNYSHVEGVGTFAATYLLHAQGRYNIVDRGSATVFSATNNAFVIGNGSSNSSVSNAFRVTFDGKSYGLSAFNSTGADYAEYFEWKDGNPDNEDRIGLFVTLDGDKIRIANPDDDYIVGIISGNQSIIGNACEDSWNDMYIRDEFDRLQYEDVEVEKEESVFNKETGEMETKTKTVTEKHIKLNPNYDSNMEYLPRSQRKEWGVVGMLGQIKVRDDGTCTPNGYCSVGENGTATKSDSGYRVLKRINESIVLVLFR